MVVSGRVCDFKSSLFKNTRTPLDLSVLSASDRDAERLALTTSESDCAPSAPWVQAPVCVSCVLHLTAALRVGLPSPKGVNSGRVSPNLAARSGLCLHVQCLGQCAGT